MKAHLDVMNVIGCVVKDVPSKNQHRDWKSYKVTAPSRHAKQIISRDNWPDGIRVRPFHPSRRNQPFQLRRPSCENNCNKEQRHGHNQYGQRKRRNNTHPQRQSQPWARRGRSSHCDQQDYHRRRGEYDLQDDYEKWGDYDQQEYYGQRQCDNMSYGYTRW